MRINRLQLRSFSLEKKNQWPAENPRFSGCLAVSQCLEAPDSSIKILIVLQLGFHW